MESFSGFVEALEGKNMHYLTLCWRFTQISDFYWMCNFMGFSVVLRALLGFFLTTEILEGILMILGFFWVFLSWYQSFRNAVLQWKKKWRLQWARKSLGSRSLNLLILEIFSTVMNAFSVKVAWFKFDLL